MRFLFMTTFINQKVSVVVLFVSFFLKKPSFQMDLFSFLVHNSSFASACILAIGIC